MCMQPVPWPEPDPQVAAAIAAMYGVRKTKRPLAVLIRDRLGEWLEDGEFAAAFGIRGRPGWSPSRLALVTVLQRAENLTDRPAADAVRTRIDWKYLLGLPLDDPGFDHTVLAEFRGRVADAGLEQVVLDALLAKLAAGGLVKAAGKQRTGSTHVIAAVAALSRLELAGESVRAEFWLGCKLHVTETCDDPPACTCPAAEAVTAGAGGHGREHDKGCAHLVFPNLITHVATTGATVTDNQMTGPIHDDLAEKHLAPGRHYLDSGYLSAALVVAALTTWGIALTGPLLAGTSAQARAGKGYARADFTVDYHTKTVTCPQGKTARSWSPCTQHGKDAIVAIFSITDCGPCPARSLCTAAKRRVLSLPPPSLAQAQAAARTAEKTIPFQADYARRAGVEGTMHQATSHGARRARYRGLPKTRLDHVYMACALNLLRLEAFWTSTPLDRRRTSHLARLEPGLAA
jgi:transposase